MVNSKVKNIIENKTIKSESNRSLMENVNEKSVSTTKLSDLHRDCLESIFKHLPEKDLLNICDTSNEFFQTSKMVYYRKFAMRTRRLELLFGGGITENPLGNPKKQIFDLKTSLQILRKFGYLVNMLHVDFNIDDKKDYRIIFYYINMYCRQRMTSAIFSNIPEAAFTGRIFELPFVNLKGLHFFDTRLAGEIVEFNKWFPALKTLTLANKVRPTDPTNIEIKFESLEQLFLVNGMPTKSIENIIKLNPQVKKFNFSSGYSGRILEMACEYMTNLEWLCILWRHHDNEKFCSISKKNGNGIYFKNLKSLSIFLEGGAMMKLFPKIPITFGPIIEFRLHTWCLFHENLIEFIGRHHTITHLHLNGRFFKFHEIYESLINLLPNLTEITMKYATVDLLLGVQFMNMNKTIEKFTCKGFTDTIVGSGIYELDNRYRGKCTLKRVK